MSSAKQNKHIGRLIVGAMSIDGSLSKAEQKKLGSTLDQVGMVELLADVGSAIDEDSGTFNMFTECAELLTSLGADAKDTAPVVFRIVCDVVAADRFVSAQEASYLSAMARKLEIADATATSIFKQVLAERKSRLEVAASGVDEQIHPHLKKLLSFPGAEELVGVSTENSIDAMILESEEKSVDTHVSVDELTRSLTVLGLSSNATLEDAKEVWRETIDNLNLPKMANLGATFVTAAINRITRINEAYKSIEAFHDRLGKSRG